MSANSHQAHMSHAAPTVNASNARALKIASGLTGVYFIVELGIGIYTRSITVISDAMHTFSAVGGVVLALIAARIALRPADKNRTFGSHRSEIIGALLNGFFLFGMALVVLYMGYNRLQNPIELPVVPMLIAAGGGLVTETISIRLLYSGQKANLNIRGAFWHIMQTFVGSIIIIIAAVVIEITGFLLIDPILGMLFGLVLLYVSWGITRDSLKILMESTPPGINLDQVREALKAIEGVRDIHHIHAWTLTSGKNLFSSHVLIEKSAENDAVLSQADGILKTRFGFFFTTIQIEKSPTEHNTAAEIDITNSS